MLKDTITRELADNSDLFYNYAFQNVNFLNASTVIFDNRYPGGGRYANRLLTIGLKSIMNREDNKNGDIMATIFHEFLHYINHEYKIYPYRYEDETEGLVFSFNVSIGEELETEDAFLDRVLQEFVFSKMGTRDASKYLDFPLLHKDLTEFKINKQIQFF